ncbi:hypothetical protein FDN13_04705 [Caloramator sp. E03]|uniref:hypothetical protein n=1 Tax=Caloramator sp. E03 TaxID=2576307 RepID=UPI001110E968|nr:hypothetical protein [Caloramator sp. E03]QCX33067.1 hypothetical protein FDN13_04705 [Caloramator sp. E03]
MSRRYNKCCCKYKKTLDLCPYDNGYFNMYYLCILILIILQFGRKNCSKDKQLIDNSILFIITLFLLVNCSCRDAYCKC